MSMGAIVIRRPGLLGAVVACTFLLAVVTCLSMSRLAHERRAQAIDIEINTAQLEAVLARAGGAGASANDVVWVVSDTGCAPCAHFARQQVRALRAEGVDVRLVLLGPGTRQRERQAMRAVIEQNGADLRLPALFWRHGDAWRGALGADAERHALEDLEPNA